MRGVLPKVPSARTTEPPKHLSTGSNASRAYSHFKCEDRCFGGSDPIYYLPSSSAETRCRRGACNEFLRWNSALDQTIRAQLGAVGDGGVLRRNSLQAETIRAQLGAVGDGGMASCGAKLCCKRILVPNVAWSRMLVWDSCGFGIRLC